MSVNRVRYAPSPTGLQHIGGVRTALYNYFFARSSGGVFILRIEDTDRERYSDESLNDLYETLSFLEIKADEGPFTGGEYAPYIQSERIELYQKYALELVQKGKAYYCFCDSERLEKVRLEQEKLKSSQVGYDRHCSNIPIKDAEKRIKNGEKYVIRLRVPQNGEIEFDDLVLGRIRRKCKDINPDPVILKSDGYPTYHLANVVDDHFMKITHVLRAQEWVPSTPLHILMYEAFGWDAPKFCHLPMVMGSDGAKLSKRHGSTSLRDFRQKGYLKDAIINYVSLVGWSYDGEREIFSKEDLEKLFSLDKIHSAPAIFDYKKLDYFNGYYIRQKSDEELAKLLMPFMKEKFKDIDERQILEFVPLIKERIKTLSEAPQMLSFVFDGDFKFSDKNIFLAKKQELAEALHYLNFALEVIKKSEDDKITDCEKILYDEALKNQTKANNVFMPLRVAVTGSCVSPPLFECIKVLGKNETIRRIENAISFLNN